MYNDTEIDIVAISQNGEEIVFSECKWVDNVDPFKGYVFLPHFSSPLIIEVVPHMFQYATVWLNLP